MAEEILVRESLSKLKLDLGKKLLIELDKSRFEIPIALWLYEVESSEWRLILYIRNYDHLDVKGLYGKIDSLLRGLESNESEINIWNITLTNERHPYISPIIELVKNTKVKLGNNKLRKTVISGVYYEDGFLYRVNI